VLALTLSFGASLAWGSADFLAGIECRRATLLTVLLVSQLVGLVLFLPFMLLLGGAPPSAGYALLGMLAGALYVVGLAALYRGLAGGVMAIVAPIAAVDALIPLAFGLLGGERPGMLAMLGIGLAVAGIVVVSLSGNDDAHGADANEKPRDSTRKSVAFGLITAVCFGGFVVALDAASNGGDALWAVGCTRVMSVLLLAGAVLFLGHKVAVGRRDALPMLAIGGLDISANALLALATTTGLLSIVGVFGSLYPVFTVLLAAAILREHPTGVQRAGTGAALLGAILITAA
jgi:drug/metabolite transporter (DMT)-like permease